MSMAQIRRTICEPLYALYSRSPFLQYERALEKTQYLPRDVLLDRQWERLQKLIQFAYRENDFYRQRFNDAALRPEDIKHAGDLRRLPVLTKEEIRQHGMRMVSCGYNVDTLMKMKTGGSTGKALELFITEDCSERRNACARRHDRWTGWKPGEPVGALWGNPVMARDIKSRLRSFLLDPYIYLDTMRMSDETVLRFAAEWKRIKPTLLFGHAHSLYLLAEFVTRLAIDDIRPKGILSTSMTLMPHERTMIERVFNVKVTDRYGCEEVSLIGCECERHAGMHLNIEHLVIEFIKDDGTPAAPGEMGAIIVTDLMNYAMPFIRYRVEDMGVPSDRVCPCGRGLPLMEKVLGRIADFLVRKDGSRVAGISLIERLLTNNPGIYQMQIVQQTRDAFNIRIVKGTAYDPQKSPAQLQEDFREIFPGSRVTLSCVDKIAPEKSGKYRFTVCQLDSCSRGEEGDSYAFMP